MPIANAYTARVVDAAGNLGPQANLSANFDYFNCNQVRANAAYGQQHPVISDPANRCSSCHANVSPADPQDPYAGTPSGSLIGVPARIPAYWCRKL